MATTTAPALKRISCNVGAKILRAADGQNGSSFQAVFIASGKTLNGEYFPPNVLADAATKFVGAKMYVNHPRMPADQMTRDLRDLAGVVESCEFSGTDLRGTIRVSETVDWLRTLVSEGIGGDLSINVMGSVEWKDEMLFVTSIAEVLSVDFVTEGAAQGRILEAFNQTEKETHPTPTPPSTMDLTTLTLATLRASRPDLVTELLTESAASDEAKALTEEHNELKAKVVAFEAKEVAAAHETLIQEALTSSGINAKLHESLRPALVPLEKREDMDKVLAGIKESLASVVPASKGNPAAEDDKKSAEDTRIQEAVAETFGVDATDLDIQS